MRPLSGGGIGLWLVCPALKAGAGSSARPSHSPQEKTMFAFSPHSARPWPGVSILALLAVLAGGCA
ncbi:hypothetical protein, partial [Methylogaea oryzae]|uniref:hypothetical protein n=1 Tax=Methylogaea oryzae TaxID=1295382 RepID=UPI001C3F25F2